VNITICELPDDRDAFDATWSSLVDHVRREHSDLVVLPEMPFAPWLAASPDFDSAAWDAAVQAHEHWLTRLPELAPAAVASSRMTITIDLRVADAAKSTYPRYALD
jgi:N-carbamoylputrescine amidase